MTNTLNSKKLKEVILEYIPRNRPGIYISTLTRHIQNKRYKINPTLRVAEIRDVIQDLVRSGDIQAIKKYSSVKKREEFFLSLKVLKKLPPAWEEPSPLERVFTWRWGDRGPEFIAGHPKGQDISQNFLLQIYAQHAASGEEEGFILVSNDQQTFASYAAGQPSNLYLTALVKVRSNLDTLEPFMSQAAKKLASISESGDVLPQLPPIFQEIENVLKTSK